MAQVRAALATDPEKKVFAFACNWCSYAGGDMAGISRLQYPASNRIVRHRSAKANPGPCQPVPEARPR